jgi:hypothetical protein
MKHFHGASLHLPPSADRVHVLLGRGCVEGAPTSLVVVRLDGTLASDTPLPGGRNYSTIADVAGGAVLLAEAHTPAGSRAASLVSVLPSGAVDVHPLAAPPELAAMCAAPQGVKDEVLVAAPIRRPAERETGLYCGSAASQVWLARIDAVGSVIDEASWHAGPGRSATSATRTRDGLALVLTTNHRDSDAEVVVLDARGHEVAHHVLERPANVRGHRWCTVPTHWHDLESAYCVSGGTHWPWGQWFACASSSGWSAASTRIQLAAVPECSPWSSWVEGQ